VFGTETHIQIPRAEPCATCQASGAAPGTSPTTCTSCGGRGQVTFQQGFFSVARTCGRCHGTGRMVATPCKDCGGDGHVTVERKLQIKIPGGVDTGSQLRISGEGEAGSAGGPPGDLYVVVRVEEHAFFQREGAALLCEVPVGYAQAALGIVHRGPQPRRRGKTKVVIPEGTQSGTTFRVRGQGVPHLGGRGRGDLHVTVRVVVPTKLTAEQRKMIDQLGKSLPSPEEQEKDRSFLGKVKDILG
jgi:molecular chaperone DnaJ